MAHIKRQTKRETYDLTLLSSFLPFSAGANKLNRNGRSSDLSLFGAFPGVTQWQRVPNILRNSQQRELLQIFTAFPFNSYPRDLYERRGAETYYGCKYKFFSFKEEILFYGKFYYLCSPNRRIRLTVRTEDSQSSNRSSILLSCTEVFICFKFYTKNPDRLWPIRIFYYRFPVVKPVPYSSPISSLTHEERANGSLSLKKRAVILSTISCP